MDSAGLRWYRTGTVDITQGSANVTGVGTNWKTAGIQPGDVFMVGNSVLYEIAQVVSNTSIALHSAFQGATGTAQNYSILRNFAGTMQAQIAAQVSELVNKYESYIDTELQQIVGPAGPTSFPYMGTWATGRQYNALDVVEYSGALYMAIAGHTSSSTNAPGAADTEWMPLSVSLSGTVMTVFANGASIDPSGAAGISIIGRNAANDITLSAVTGAIRLQQTSAGTTSTLCEFTRAEIDELKSSVADSGTVTVVGEYVDVRYQKIGKMVFLNIYNRFKKEIQSSVTSVVLAVLPEGVRPAYYIPVVCYIDYDVTRRVVISSNGEIGLLMRNLGVTTNTFIMGQTAFVAA